MSDLLPKSLAGVVGAYNIDAILRRFRDVSLAEVVKASSITTFLGDAEKYCYTMRYSDLNFLAQAARDNYTDAIVPAHRDNYVKQQMHSLSGEGSDLCLHTYSPAGLVAFIEKNKAANYTYLPLTVHASDSANGYRHDMLIIFDNRKRLFYWFDGCNREDYLHFARGIPKNAIDILMMQLAENAKLGYSYEPSPSWVIQGVCQPMAPQGQLDFVMSTAWCHLVMLTLQSFESPTGLLSVLDTLSTESRFNLLYRCMMNLVTDDRYHQVIPGSLQVNFFEAKPAQPVVAYATRADPPNVQNQINDGLRQRHVAQNTQPIVQTVPAIRYAVQPGVQPGAQLGSQSSAQPPNNTQSTNITDVPLRNLARTDSKLSDTGSDIGLLSRSQKRSDDSDRCVVS